MSKIIGIDLGTTNSCVAVMDGGEVRVITNREGARTTPSMVAVTQNGERLVGEAAKRQAVTNPTNSIFGVKRLIGRAFDSPSVQKDIPVLPYIIVPSRTGEAHVKLQGRVVSPTEISSMILAGLKRDAEDYLGEPVNRAVIAVPAYFDDCQRQATRDAARMAGLSVERIINEPTAAALAYGLQKGRDGLVAVFDMGGGTFDISILRLERGLFEVIATSGDSRLGGEDFDLRLVDHLADAFLNRHGLDLRGDNMALQRLKDAVERARVELSRLSLTDVNLPFIIAGPDGPMHLKTKISRAALEAKVVDLAARADGPCRRALADAGLMPGDIDEVVVVGGLTRMPLILSRVESFFGRKPHLCENPDEAVAVGAAAVAGMLAGELAGMELLDVTPLSLGVETAGGTTNVVIPRNTALPTRQTGIFSTAEDGQAAVSVHVVQGERRMVADNRSLGHFVLQGIEPAPKGVPRIELTFDIDASGILHVSARNLSGGGSTSMAIKAAGGLSEDEIASAVDRAARHAELDDLRAALAEARQDAEDAISRAENSLASGGSGHPAVAFAQKTLAQLRVDLDGSDTAAIKRAIEKLRLAMDALPGGKGEAPRNGLRPDSPTRPKRIARGLGGGRGRAVPK